MIGTAGWYPDPTDPSRTVFFNGSYAESSRDATPGERVNAASFWHLWAWLKSSKPT